MTITLPLNEIKDFVKASSSITGKKILPILNYIKIGNGFISKTILDISCQVKCSYEGDPFLIDEIILSAFADSKSESISFTVSNTSIIIFDGFIKEKQPFESCLNFPDIPICTTDWVELNNEQISLIRIASNFRHLDDDFGGNFRHIHIANGYLFASDMAMMFITKTDGIPDILIDKSAIPFLIKFETISISQDEKNVYLTNGIINYCFTKSFDKTPGFVTEKYTLLQGLESTFTLQKSKLIHYITHVNKTCIDPVAVITLTNSGSGTTISYVNGLTGKENESFIEGVTLPSDFSMNAKKINAAIKSIPFETLECCIYNDATLVIKNDKDIFTIQKTI